MKYDNLWARLMANIHEPENEQACWCWKAGLSTRGYGQLSLRVDGRHTKVLAHRVAFTLVNRPDVELWRDEWDFVVVPAEPLEYDDTIDHTCRNCTCINPAHLQVVPRVKNTQLRWSRSAN